MKLSNIFKTKSSWCKNANARLNNGDPFSLVIPHSSSCLKTQRLYDQFPKQIKKIKQWSLQGAISYYINDPNKRLSMMRDLRSAINKHTGKDIPVAQFNNDPNTSFEDLQAVIKIVESKRN